MPTTRPLKAACAPDAGPAHPHPPTITCRSSRIHLIRPPTSLLEAPRTTHTDHSPRLTRSLAAIFRPQNRCRPPTIALRAIRRIIGSWDMHVGPNDRDASLGVELYWWEAPRAPEVFACLVSITRPITGTRPSWPIGTSTAGHDAREKTTYREPSCMACPDGHGRI